MNRILTKNPWSERPEQADQTVNVLLALGFYIMLDEHRTFVDGVLVSETFTKRNKENGATEKVTVSYNTVRTYDCEVCGRRGLVSDKVTHGQYHQRQASMLASQYDYDYNKPYIVKTPKPKTKQYPYYDYHDYFDDYDDYGYRY